MTSDTEDEAVTLHHTNFAESLKQLLRKSRQLMTLTSSALLTVTNSTGSAALRRVIRHVCAAKM